MSMKTKPISIDEVIEQFISRADVEALLQRANRERSTHQQRVSGLATRILQGLNAIEEAKAKLLEPLEASARENIRQNLATMRKSVWNDVTQLRNLGLLRWKGDV